MQFARVYGFVTQRSGTDRWLTVVLDDGREMRTVRDEAIAIGISGEDPGWLADQLVQETIGIELAEEGWEVVGKGSVEGDDPVGIHAIATSPVWIVRRA